MPARRSECKHRKQRTKCREASRSGGDRHRLVRRHPRRDAVALALVDKLHICEIRPERLAEVKALTKPATATLDYQDIIKNDNISVVYISTTPETNHYPDRARLPEGRQERAAGEADRARAVGGRRADHARQAQQPEVHHRLFAALQPKIAYAKKKIDDGTLGKVVSRAGEPPHHAHARQEDRQAACGSRRW